MPDQLPSLLLAPDQPSLLPVPDHMSVDVEERVSVDHVRDRRLGRARAALGTSDLEALLDSTSVDTATACSKTPRASTLRRAASARRRRRARWPAPGAFSRR